MSVGRDRGLSRRRFLAGAATAGAGAVAASVGGGLLTSTGLLPSPNVRAQTATVSPLSVIPFEGVHQAGIDRPIIAQPDSIVAAFDVVAMDRDALRVALGELTRRIRQLAAGEPPPPLDATYPPPESGVLGSSIGPSDLTVMVAAGASLFDDRFGLADRKPRQLVAMPHFPGDVIDPGRVHGDLLVQICAVDEMACIHALRYLMAGVRAQLVLRWMQSGFHRPDLIPAEGKTTTRNLLGFKDGTANPSVGGDVFQDRVWVQAGDGEPAWATGGSYLAVRIIRMFVERWDRSPLAEQQAIIGRSKRTGAPLDGQREEDPPDYAQDLVGAVIPLDAHIRLANPRTPGSERSVIFRRGYSYSRGFDEAGLLEQGLLFMAFQRDLDAGFQTIQARLAHEPLAEYIQPQGGGYFFVLPGVLDAAGNLGDSLLA